MAANIIRTTCCVVGGGPAGIMVGALLARAGVAVIVLEKHADFFRDFRGDTIHPSTLELLSELGLLEGFLELPHQQISRITLDLNGKLVQGPDLSGLPTRCKFVAIAPQWDFLNFMAEYARSFPSFHLMMQSEATRLIQSEGKVTGVMARTPEEEVEIQADLVIAADGRGSILRQQSQLPLMEFGVPIDVLWYRLPKGDHHAADHALGHIANGQMLVTIDRGTYLQCATVIAKGGFAKLQSRGLEAFRGEIVGIAPFLQHSVHELQSWDQVKLLTVQMNRLKQWFLPGLLCIGDAAHAMSPVGGVGVNLAIQDAVATANLLAVKLHERTVTVADLKNVQKRREWPAKMTQRIQTFAHKRLFDPNKGFGQTAIFSPLGRMLLGLAAPLVRRAVARVVGIGIRPEHIEPPHPH
ncbi:FAD-dependent oxidoreductase [Planctomicrobium sp. SH661]|uniref:FAD-dependent oxidoreductase n=1 Tax=Planctomicrobium sp. SH661 TaxID=3448124 RepID=UPI003F5C50F8